MEKEYYTIKGQKYFGNIRLDIAKFLENQRGLNVLDIGGGSGNTLLYLKNEGIASSIHLFDIVNQVKDENHFDSLTLGDINITNLRSGSYDVIILSDVLEHMLNPDILLTKASKHLKTGGKLLISMPNIRYIKAMYKIFFKGSFKYENSGVFDKTHVRFYCKSDMIALFDNYDDLKINKFVSVNKFVNSKLSFIDRITFGAFSGLLSMQFLFEVEKK